MANHKDLHNFFKRKDYRMIIAADGEPRVSYEKNGKIVTENPAGGVAIALDSIAQATNALYIARAKNAEEMNALDKNGILKIKGTGGEYSLKRLLFNEVEIEGYYQGFSNQTLWPLCHVAYEEPRWTDEWYKKYRVVNERYAEAIKKSINPKEKTFIWINDYHLSLVPRLLGKQKNTVVAMFWHIPWPTWEIFRILPYKEEILRSLLCCDFLAFHRGYQARNFLQTVERELQTRIDQETQSVHFDKNVTYVKNLPMGIDVDVVKSLIRRGEPENGLKSALKHTLNVSSQEHSTDWYFEKYKVIFGADRLDYTKGLKHRLTALDRFFDKNPQFRNKVIYLGIIAPSREAVPSYQKVRMDVEEMAVDINLKYGNKQWKPIHLIYDTFKRAEIINFYHRADACVVTPLDDGMNLVSKEFVVASSMAADPGMLVLSQFTGSAIDLTPALIVNPYDIEQVADSIKKAILMPKTERVKRIKQMAASLDENNLYTWGIEFIRQAIQSKQ